MFSSRITLHLGQIRIKCISVSGSFRNGHAKSACVVLVANHSFCVFSGETPCLILRDRQRDRQTERQRVVYDLFFIFDTLLL